MLESIETRLLGRTTLAFDRWAARTGWRPDAPSAYCWRCGSSVGPHEASGDGCAECRGLRVAWDRALRLARYDGAVRDAMLALKFHALRQSGVGLGAHLGEVIRTSLALAQVEPYEAVLAPIPTHRWRRIARGVDHTLVLARAAALTSGCRVRRVLGVERRPLQVGLSATARAANIRGAFSLSRRGSRLLASSGGGRGEPRPRVWVLIDDVRTTGATLSAAARTLRAGLKRASDEDSGGEKEKPEIWVACAAVAGENRRVLPANEL